MTQQQDLITMAAAQDRMKMAAILGASQMKNQVKQQQTRRAQEEVKSTQNTQDNKGHSQDHSKGRILVQSRDLGVLGYSDDDVGTGAETVASMDYSAAAGTRVTSPPLRSPSREVEVLTQFTPNLHFMRLCSGPM